MTKRRTMLAAAVVLMLACLTWWAPALAWTPVHDDYVFEKQWQISTAQVVGDMLYAVSQGNLVAFSQMGEAPEIVINVAQSLSIMNWESLKLSSDGEELYLLSPFQGKVYRLEGDSWTLVVNLDISSIGYPSYEGRYVIFNCPVIVGDSLYLVSRDPNTYDPDLYRFSLKDGRCELLALYGSEVWEIAPYKDGKLLVVDSYKDGPMVFDPQKPTELSPLVETNYNISSAVYDAAGDQLYWLSGNQLMRYRGQEETLGPGPVDGTSEQRCAGLWHGHYVALTSYGLYACDTTGTGTKADEGVTLNVWTGSRVLLTEELTKFHLENPGVTVRIIEELDADETERITTENLSGDGSIDLFLLLSQYSDSSAVFERGFAAPILSQRLQESVQAMYPQIQSFLTQDGAVMGYPCLLSWKPWTVRPDLLEQLDLGEAPTTMDEYVDMLLRWHEKIAGTAPGCTFGYGTTAADHQGQAAALIAMQYIKRYATKEEPLSFNTPVFRGLMEKLTLLNQWKTRDFAASEAGTLPMVINEGGKSPLSRQTNPEDLGETCILPPVFVPGEEPIQSAGLYYFVINPHSKHQTEAGALLEYLSREMGVTTKYELYPDYNELVEQDNYQGRLAYCQQQVEAAKSVIQSIEETLDMMTDANYMEKFPELYAAEKEGLADRQDALAMAEAELRQLEANRYLCSAEELAEYRSIAPYMKLDKSALAWKMYYGLDVESSLAKYFEGVATLDQVINEIDRRVAMMYYEGL